MGIVLLDHGLYETITKDTRISLCKFWECLVLKDVQGLKKYAKELNVDGKDIGEYLYCRSIYNNFLTYIRLRQTS